MPRIVSYPLGLRLTSLEPLSGPNTIGSASTNSIGGYNQTVAGVGYTWEFGMSFELLRDKKARAFRGWVMSMHSGANITRFTLIDGDRPAREDLNIPDTNTPYFPVGYVPNGVYQRSRTDIPMVQFDEAFAEKSTVVRLPDFLWGHKLDVGTQLGFPPLHFGVYMITEVIKPGEYRIFPPLRKALKADAFATLFPTIAVRMRGPEDATLPRSAVFIEDANLRMVEVLDADVRDNFTG